MEGADCTRRRTVLRYSSTRAVHHVTDPQRSERKVSMSGMTSEQRAMSHAIIHTASASAGAVGAGLAQVPCSDNLVITPIQLAMTISLGQVFGIDLSESSAKAALASAAAGTIGRTAVQVFAGWIPLVGNAINAATAASLTEAIGWMLAEDFAKRAELAA